MADRFDGFVSLVEGQDQTTDSLILPRTKYVKGLNVTARGGIIGTRPPLRKIAISDALFTTGKFQGIKKFRLNNADRLIIGIAGNVIGINISTLAVTNYSAIAGSGTLDPTADTFYFVQADKFFIAQDGTNDGLIINDNDDPDHARVRANPEVPIGTIMAYGQGRIFVVPTFVGTPPLATGGVFMVAGDIMLPNDRATVLSFTETDYLSGGLAISLPNELGRITGMEFLRNVRSGTGLGSLVVFARDGASAFQISAPRSQWQDITLSQVLFMGAGTGTESPFSLIGLNNDIGYRSVDGVRTVGYSTAALSGVEASMADEPISREVEPILKEDDDTDYLFTYTQNIDSRFFCLTGGVSDDAGGHYFNSLISLDSSVLSSLGSRSTPAWDGIWTGLKFTGLATGRYQNKEVLFVTGRNANDENVLYWIDPDDFQDGTETTPSATLCRVYTKAMDFVEEQAQSGLLEFLYAEIWFKDISGTVNATVYYRPLGYPLWSECDSMTICASDGSLSRAIKKVRFVPGTITNDPTNDLSNNISSEFEFCVEWSGKAKVSKALFKAIDISQDFIQACDVDSECKTLAISDISGIELNDNEYVIE